MNDAAEIGELGLNLVPVSRPAAVDLGTVREVQVRPLRWRMMTRRSALSLV